MSQRNDGGPAFPAIWSHGFPENKYPGGMSLRDYFAAAVVGGIFASGSHRDVASEITIAQRQQDMGLSATQVGHIAEARIADMAYAVADAMLKAREQARSDEGVSSQ